MNADIHIQERTQNPLSFRVDGRNICESYRVPFYFFASISTYFMLFWYVGNQIFTGNIILIGPLMFAHRREIVYCSNIYNYYIMCVY